MGYHHFHPSARRARALAERAAQAMERMAAEGKHAGQRDFDEAVRRAAGAESVAAIAELRLEQELSGRGSLA